MDTEQLPQSAPNTPDPGATSLEEKQNARPDHVPNKFWDGQLGTVRTEALLKSYSELESRMSETTTEIPDSPDQYNVITDHPALVADSDINSRLHAAGFSQAQAQLVYDLAKEKLLPMMDAVSGNLEKNAEATKLENHFGGQEKWQIMSREIGTWGQKNLPPEAFTALSSSFGGVIAMQQMMSSGEPAILANQGQATSGMSETDLKRMMHDPRYWRDQDPAFIDQVRQGFKTLYPG